MRRYGHSLARTLQQLHEVGVVVQDIKPENVLLDMYDKPVLADFGISAVVGWTTKIMPASVKGTFNFMAPEAFEPPLGVEADVWSLACLVLEMATGAAPWAEMQMQQIITQVLVRQRAPPVADTVPAAETLRRYFALEAVERPTAGELADARAPEAAEVSEAAGDMARVTAERDELRVTLEQRDEQIAALTASVAVSAHRLAELKVIASEGLVAPMPQGWTEHRTPEANPYFHNASTNKSSLQHPYDPYYRRLVGAVRDGGWLTEADARHGARLSAGLRQPFIL